ncbi:MAG: lipoate protein ligase C-terminal domain-containing protein [Candidatus Gracilibacteria bacterium]|jgi:lipoate-protein ligase A
MKRAIYKVPNGKLLKILLEEVEGKITILRITGDFFMYPEENIKSLEHFLTGCELNKEKLDAKIKEFFEKNPTQLFGVDADSLVLTILNANATNEI